MNLAQFRREARKVMKNPKARRNARSTFGGDEYGWKQAQDMTRPELYGAIRRMAKSFSPAGLPAEVEYPHLRRLDKDELIELWHWAYDTSKGDTRVTGEEPYGGPEWEREEKGDMGPMQWNPKARRNHHLIVGERVKLSDEGWEYLKSGDSYSFPGCFVTRHEDGPDAILAFDFFKQRKDPTGRLIRGLPSKLPVDRGRTGEVVEVFSSQGRNGYFIVWDGDSSPYWVADKYVVSANSTTRKWPGNNYEGITPKKNPKARRNHHLAVGEKVKLSQRGMRAHFEEERSRFTEKEQEEIFDDPEWARDLFSMMTREAKEWRGKVAKVDKTGYLIQFIMANGRLARKKDYHSDKDVVSANSTSRKWPGNHFEGVDPMARKNGRARRNMPMRFDGIEFDTVNELLAYKKAIIGHEDRHGPGGRGPVHRHEPTVGGRDDDMFEEEEKPDWTPVMVGNRVMSLIGGKGAFCPTYSPKQRKYKSGKLNLRSPHYSHMKLAHFGMSQKQQAAFLKEIQEQGGDRAAVVPDLDDNPGWKAFLPSWTEHDAKEALKVARSKYGLGSKNSRQCAIGNPRLGPSPTIGHAQYYRQPTNAGPYTPQTFPYGYGGRPATYKVAKKNASRGGIADGREGAAETLAMFRKGTVTTCPTCRARGYEPCVTSSGKKTKAHAARVKKAKKYAEHLGVDPSIVARNNAGFTSLSASSWDRHGEAHEEDKEQPVAERFIVAGSGCKYFRIQPLPQLKGFRKGATYWAKDALGDPGWVDVFLLGPNRRGAPPATMKQIEQGKATSVRLSDDEFRLAGFKPAQRIRKNPHTTARNNSAARRWGRYAIQMEQDYPGWAGRGPIEANWTSYPTYAYEQFSRSNPVPVGVVAAQLVMALVPVIVSMGQKTVNKFKRASTDGKIKMLKKWSWLSPPVRAAMQNKKLARAVATKIDKVLKDPEAMEQIQAVSVAGARAAQAGYAAHKGSKRQIATRRNPRLRPVPSHISPTPRAAAEHISAIGVPGQWPIGDLFHARLALIYAMAPNNYGKHKQILNAVERAYPQYDWAKWWEYHMAKLRMRGRKDKTLASKIELAAANPRKLSSLILS